MNIMLANKPIEIHVSQTASAALAQRTMPLLVEMELLFSCLLRKKVRFYEEGATTDMAVSQGLAVSFRAIMTKSCSISSLDGQPPAEDFPIKKVHPFIPHWLSIDFRNGQWLGDFGY